MNKESNILKNKNIITVLLTLLVLGMMVAGNPGTSTITVGNVTANLTDNTSFVNKSVNINFTIKDTFNTTSWYNITFPTGFNAGGAIVVVTINGSTNPVNWTNNTATFFVNVSSNDPTNFSANNGTIQYINLSNITTPPTAGNFMINISTSNSGVVIPLNYTTTVLAPVSLGNASNFAVLAGSGISDVPTSAITGDIGVSPNSGSSITGFSSPLICPEITGTVYAVDAAGPSCASIDAARLTAAKAALTVAYIDAAGRSVPAPATVSGDQGGVTLPPGIYKSTSTLSIASGNLILDGQGDANSVWIFQIVYPDDGRLWGFRSLRIRGQCDAR
jgi:hypothetical protein